MRADSIDNLAEVVWGNVRRHANRNPGSTIDQQIWKGSWENSRFGARLVVIRDKVDRVLVHVGHERGAEVGHACFGVTHRRWRIAFDRPKIALSIDKRFAHRPRLRHMDEGGVDYCFAVRMIITAGVAADFRTLAMLSIWKQR